LILKYIECDYMVIEQKDEDFYFDFEGGFYRFFLRIYLENNKVGRFLMKISNYNEFIDRVNELGFMTLSDVLPGLPSLSGETKKSNWHTGDYESDPWCWKDRVAKEKKLAYGCILGGHKGFVSPKMYLFFYYAYHPTETIKELWTAGKLCRTTWDLWNLFEERSLLSTSDIRHLMGITIKNGGSNISKDGEPYGWPACVYDKVVDWIPTNWFDDKEKFKPEEAREKILEKGMVIGNNFSRKQLAKKLKLG